MRIILYGKVKAGSGKRLWQLIKDLIPNGQVVNCQTTDVLANELCQYKSGSTVAVLLCSSRQDLADLVASRNLFDDIPVILILPDRKTETVSEGHKLYPRYLTYADSSFHDVFSVLEKMLKLQYSHKIINGR